MSVLLHAFATRLFVRVYGQILHIDFKHQIRITYDLTCLTTICHEQLE